MTCQDLHGKAAIRNSGKCKMMNNGTTTATREYDQAGVRYEVESASPHRLIQMMMQRVLTKIAVARGHMQRNAVGEKGRHLSDAISIINGLQASLNHKPNAELSGNFDALYDYMSRRLLEANMRDDLQLLDEVAGLMREIKEAWDAIADQVGPAPEASPNRA
jgi:flagellar protein FliS